MAKDIQHQSITFRSHEIEHQYGENVHIISSPLMLSYLARLGHPETKQPEITHLVGKLYDFLSNYVIDSVFPKKIISAPTRMKTFHPEGIYEGEAIDPDTPCISVGLARAGTYPSQICYEKLNYIVNPDLVRQDHFYIARLTDEKGQVIGVTVSGSKIGGSAEGAIVLLPDPMGATGGTIIEAANYYKSKVGGKPKAIVALHLIVTPEYLKKVTTQCPELKVFSLRLDRGLSAPEVLNEIPGKRWPEEKGLNDHQYIVPGAGGLGEILNNSWC